MMCQADALGDLGGTFRDDGGPKGTRAPRRRDTSVSKVVVDPDEPSHGTQGVTMTTDTTTATDHRMLSPAVLVGGTVALTTMLNIAFHVGEIVFTDHDPHAPDGPLDSIVSVGVVGGISLVLALAIALPLSRDSQRARIGAIVLGILAVITLPIFWSGAPAIFGACAAWLGGLTRGSQPQSGAARAFGVVGIVIVVLEIVATVFGGAVGTWFD